MEMIEILNDVARSRQELADLALTEDVDPARLQFCDDVITRLEHEIELTIFKPWIPKNFGAVESAILGTLQRIEETEQLIVDAAVPMLIKKQPDEMIRFNVALLSLHTLRFQLQMLFDAAVRMYNRLPAYAN